MFEPYEKYFMVEIKPKLRWKNYEYCFKQCLDEVKKYYSEWSEYGFSSDKVYENDLKSIAKRKADIIWTNEISCKCGLLSLLSIEITDEYIEESIISMVENRKDFIRWIKS